MSHDKQIPFAELKIVAFELCGSNVVILAENHAPETNDDLYYYFVQGHTGPSIKAINQDIRQAANGALLWGHAGSIPLATRQIANAFGIPYTSIDIPVVK